MNSIWCCGECGDDFEEFPTNTFYRHCICLRFFFHQLFSGYGSLFERIEGPPVSSTMQATASSSSGVGLGLPTACLNAENHSPPYDTDHRFTRGLVSRREKSMTRFQEDSGMEILGFVKKDSTQDPKSGHPVSLEKGSTEGLFYEQSSDNEDVCPTCLDEYTTENPKIVTRCSHHFHLGCIYEWMERSDTCPMCGMVMEFCESP